MNRDRFLCAFHASPLWLSPRGLGWREDGEAAAAEGLDLTWYCRKFRMAGHDFPGLRDCVSDYERNAGPLRRSPNLAFDEVWYRHEYPDVDDLVKAGKWRSGWEHYLEEGARKGYNPAFWFDERWYLQQHSEVSRAVKSGQFICGFEHYLLYGIRRDLPPSIYFNPGWYRKRNMEGAHTGPRSYPVAHYLLLNSEARPCPVPFFEPAWYADRYFGPLGDSEGAASIPAYEHYVLFGRRLGHSPSPYFDEMAYRDTYGEVREQIRAGIYRSGFEHYATEGPRNGFLPKTHLLYAGLDYSGPEFMRIYEQSLLLNLVQLKELSALSEPGQ